MKKLGRMVALILTFSLLLASSAFAATKASSQILKHSIDRNKNPRARPWALLWL